MCTPTRAVFDPVAKTTRLHTPRGSSGKELGLIIFFGGCIVIAEMPSRNCRWLQNCDIAIADVPSRNCQCMCKRTMKKRTLRVSPSVF